MIFGAPMRPMRSRDTDTEMFSFIAASTGCGEHCTEGISLHLRDHKRCAPKEQNWTHSNCIARPPQPHSMQLLPIHFQHSPCRLYRSSTGPHQFLYSLEREGGGSKKDILHASSVTLQYLAPVPKKLTVADTPSHFNASTLCWQGKILRWAHLASGKFQEAVDYLKWG